MCATAIVVVSGCTTTKHVALLIEQPTERRHPIPGHGTLSLVVPNSWKDDLTQPPNALPPTITFRPYSSDSFRVLITVLWSLKQEEGFNDWPAIDTILKKLLRNMFPTADEQKLALMDILGKSCWGSYFTFTDRSPEPDGYRYVTAGSIGTGELLLSFTIFTHEMDSQTKEDALNMVQSARQESGFKKGEIVRKYHVGILNINLHAAMAHATGMHLMIIKDTPSEFDFVLNYTTQIFAIEVSDGIVVRLQADDPVEGRTLLNALMRNSELIEAKAPTLFLRGEEYEKKKAVINEMLKIGDTNPVVRP